MTFDIGQRISNYFNLNSNPRSGTNEFQMLSWTIESNPAVVLVQFIGNHELSVDRPHGNAKPTDKRPARNYVRTAASVIR